MIRGEYMSRPMAAAGFAYLTGLMFAAFALPAWGLGISLTIVIALLLAAALSSVKQKKFTPLCLAAICLLVSFLQYTGVYTAKIAPSLEYENSQGNMVAVITDTETKPGHTLHFCRLESFDGNPVTNDIPFTLRDYHASLFDSGDRISADVKFEAVDTVYSPKNFIFNLDKGIVLEAKLQADSVQVLERFDAPISLSEKIRNFFSIRMKSFMPLSGSDLAEAMLFGNKSGVAGIIEDNFRLSGTAHMLAVSGFHLTVLMGFVGVFCEFIGLGRKSRSILSALFILLYMFVTGFPYSVVRAGIMTLILCLSQLSGREKDSFSALSLAVLIICISSPMAIWDMGFLLSVAALLGIVLIHEKLHTYCSMNIYNSSLPAPMRFALRAVIPPISLGLCAAVGTFPLIAGIFSHYNLLSIISSTLLSIPATVLLAGSLAIAILGDMGISRLIGMAVSFSAEIMKELTAFFAEFGNISLPFSLGILILYFLIILAIFALSPRYSSGRKVIAALICCSLVFSAATVADTYRTARMEGFYISASDKGESVLVVKSGKGYCISTESALPYGARKFASDMGIEIIGSNMVDNKAGTSYSVLNEGEFYETRAGITLNALGLDLLLNDDLRVDSPCDILIQQADKLELPLQADIRELTVLCLKTPRDKSELTKFMPAGRNIILDPGCGVFIEFTDGLTVTKYDYGY